MKLYILNVENLILSYTHIPYVFFLFVLYLCFFNPEARYVRRRNSLPNNSNLAEFSHHLAVKSFGDTAGGETSEVDGIEKMDEFLYTGANFTIFCKLSLKFF